MASNRVVARNNFTADTSRGFSPNVWRNCPLASLNEDPSIGTFFYENWTRVPVLTTPTITTQANYGGGWKAFGSSGGTVVTSAEQGGGLVLTETDDNEGIGLATIALPFKIIRGGGDFWMECRFKTNEVADTKHGIFIGLLDSATLSATVPIAAAGTLADENFVGFHRLEADGDQMDTVYKADGVTQVTVQADALHTALVADTYTKIGMRYNASDYTLTFYQNNLELSSTKTVPVAAGTDFPNDVQMGLVVAMLCASSDDAIVTLSWIAAAQLHV